LRHGVRYEFFVESGGRLWLGASKLWQ
jgi:hypothetical protein